MARFDKLRVNSGVKEKKGTPGCAIAIIALCGLLILLFAASLLLTWVNYSSKQDEARAVETILQASEDVPAEVALDPQTEAEKLGVDVILHANSSEKLSLLEDGQQVERDYFLAWQKDEKLTKLSRQDFRDKANGSQVEWQLKLNELRETGQGLEGKFEVRYLLKEEYANRQMESFGKEYINVHFRDGQRDRLIELRKEDWVTIGGELELDINGNAKILDAVLRDEE